jgi:transcriptional regulator with XRE-family HTH domain
MAVGTPEKPLENYKKDQELGGILREARHKSGLSISELSAMIGYTRAHVSGVEHGKSGASKDFVKKCDEALLSSGSLIEAFYPTVELKAATLLKEASRYLDYLARPEDFGQQINLSDLPDFVDNDREILKILLRIARRITISGLKLDKHITICSSYSRSEASLINEGINTLIGSMLSNGMEVDHYIRLEPTAGASSTLATQLLSFLKLSDDYKPYAVNSNPALGPVIDMVLIPDNLAILFIATKEQSRVDTAWIYTDTEKVNSLSANAVLVKNRTMPFASMYTRNQGKPVFERYPNSWDVALATAEAHKGDRYNVLDGLSSITEPLEDFADRLRREASRITSDEKIIKPWLDKTVEIRNRRLTEFPSKNSIYKYRDICPLSALYEYRKTGKISSNDNVLEPATKAEYVKHLRHSIDLLKVFPNYELALVDDGFRDLHMQTWWEVKGTDTQGTVFLEIVRIGKTRRETAYVALHHAAIAKAFRTYFNQLWDSINPDFKDKNWVIKQLEIACQA